MNDIFSEKAKTLISQLFPDTHVTNVNLQICLNFEGNRQNEFQLVNIGSSHNIFQDIVKSAEFVADMWIDDELPEDDNYSINDLLGAEIGIQGKDGLCNHFFVIAFELKTKAAPKKAPVERTEEPSWKKHINL